MSANRKLQTEIDRTLKKVQEGVDLFEQIWHKLHMASGPSQKEKFEGDLKKEIKKLQRCREQIKAWSTSSDVKDKAPLAEARKRIEQDMERFKVCEKEFKTKAYSKEGLAQGLKVDPAERAREETREWLQKSIDSLNLQLETVEAELETLSLKKGRSKGDSQAKELLAATQDRHRFHVNKLELVLRLLDNDSLSVESVGDIKDGVEFYVESNQEPDFVEDTELYDNLNLKDALLDEEESSDHDDDDRSYHSSETPSGGGVASAGRGPSPLSTGPAQHILPTPPGPPMSPGKRQGSATEPPRPQPSQASGGLNPPPRMTTSPLATAKVTPGAPALVALKPREESKPAGPLRQSPTSQPLDYRAAAVAASRPLGTHTTPAPLDYRSVAAAGAMQPPPVRTSPPPQAVRPSPVPQAKDLLSNVVQKGFDQLPAGGKATPPTTTLPPGRPVGPGILPLTKPEPLSRGQGTLPTATVPPAPQSVPPGATLVTTLSAPTAPVSTSPVAGEEAPKPEEPPTIAPPPPIVTTTAGIVSGAGSGGLESLGSGIQEGGIPLQDVANSVGLLESSLRSCPHPMDSERNQVYAPRNPFPVPACFPQRQASVFENPAIFEKFGTDTLFFIFYYQQGTYQQYLAARELKKQSWRYHKKYLTWFQRHEEPKTTTDEFEQGTYVYFDYETGWCQRIKTEFTFEYQFLEDELV